MFSAFTQLTAPLLNVVRKGWFSREYELSDGNATYGRLTYKGWFFREALAETAGASWKIIRRGIFSRELVVSTVSGETAGVITLGWFRRRAVFTLSSGRTILFTQPSALKRRFVWTGEQGGELMEWRTKGFSSLLAEITFPNKITDDPLLPLLSLAAIYIILSKRRGHLAAAT